MASIKALAAHFGGGAKDWSIDWGNSSGPSSMSFEMPDDMTPAEIRRCLLALGSYNKRTLRGDGDCKLTGAGTDEDAIDGFRRAFVQGKERDLGALMQAAFSTWIKAAWSNYEYDFGDEGMTEDAEANGYRFYKDGGFYRQH